VGIEVKDEASKEFYTVNGTGTGYKDLNPASYALMMMMMMMSVPCRTW
jgi:hypothetical protein